MTRKDRVEKKGGGITRRDFLKYASASAGVAAATLALTNSVSSPVSPTKPSATTEYLHDGHPLGVAATSQTVGGRTPMDFLTDFYTVPKDPVTGERIFELDASPRTITVARDVQFPAWTFSAPQRGPMVPGPTLRCAEGDKVLLRFHNGDPHPHTIHLHGIHPADADGVFEVRNPGQTYSYKLTAEPFGLFPYHCHVMPVKKHISKGLYGALIIDPVDPVTGQVTRPAADREMVMVMNGFDVDFDDENEFYSVNGIANYYFDNPIQIAVGELVRVYLVNMTEFDPVNSFHLHGNMFRMYRTGTRFDPTANFDRNTSRSLDDRVKEWLYRDAFAEVTDVVFLGQGERAILEFIPKHPGRFLFHAHQSEFLELGWTGLFNVV